MGSQGWPFRGCDMTDTGVGPVKFNSRKRDRFGCTVSSLGNLFPGLGWGHGGAT